MKHLQFRYDLTIAVRPGHAIFVRAGEVMAFPPEVAARLLRRAGVIEVAGDVDARLVLAEQRALPNHIAQKVAPLIDPARLVADRERAIKAVQASRDVGRKLSDLGITAEELGIAVRDIDQRASDKK